MPNALELTRSQRGRKCPVCGKFGAVDGWELAPHRYQSASWETLREHERTYWCQRCAIKAANPHTGGAS